MACTFEHTGAVSPLSTPVFCCVPLQGHLHHTPHTPPHVKTPHYPTCVGQLESWSSGENVCICTHRVIHDPSGDFSLRHAPRSPAPPGLHGCSQLRAAVPIASRLDAHSCHRVDCVHSSPCKISTESLDLPLGSAGGCLAGRDTHSASMKRYADTWAPLSDNPPMYEVTTGV